MTEASARRAGAASGGPAPLFAQVRDALRGEILAGRLGPGDRLPSESELIARFGVSRITVRQALAELQAAELVQTVNGKGSFVTRPGRGEARGPLVGILEAMRKRGHRAFGRLLSYRRVPATRIVANELALPVDTIVGAVTVLRYCDDVPFAIGTTWCPLEISDRLVEQDLIDQDVTIAMQVGLGLRHARTRVRVLARAADARLAARLQYTPGAPVLRVLTTSIGWDQRPQACSRTDARADMMDYRVTLRG
jgi:GntR family transcriptional regulator